MKTIAEIINKANVGDKLTDGKQKWTVIRYEGGKIAVPVKYTKDSFELWAMCGLEKRASLPGLKIVK
jgi:hypothetical protein